MKITTPLMTDWYMNATKAKKCLRNIAKRVFLLLLAENLMLKINSKTTVPENEVVVNEISQLDAYKFLICYVK